MQIKEAFCIKFITKKNQNQKSLLVERQNDNTSPGLGREDKSLALKREENLDMQSSDTSEEEMRESGRTFYPPPLT